MPQLAPLQSVELILLIIGNHRSFDIFEEISSSLQLFFREVFLFVEERGGLEETAGEDQMSGNRDGCSQL